MPLDKKIVRRFVRQALLEDAARGDITTLTFIPEGLKASSRIVAGQKGIVCGLSVAKEVFKVFDRGITFQACKKDGQSVRKAEVIAYVRGSARSIISCERVALNFLSHLCGIATQTGLLVKKVKPKGIEILDTRKTTPLLRYFEKYAVLTGRGRNHRFDLSEKYLVKDNHLEVLKNTARLGVLSRRDRRIPFEIEVRNLEELKEVLNFSPDVVMLDNFTPRDIKKGSALIRAHSTHKKKRPLIELSGGITPKNISRYAIRGIDFISLGALTHSSGALDVSLEITKICNGTKGVRLK